MFEKCLGTLMSLTILSTKLHPVILQNMHYAGFTSNGVLVTLIQRSLFTHLHCTNVPPFKGNLR